MPISSRVDVDVIDQFPTDTVPSLSIPVVLGTSGIAEIKDEIFVMESAEGIPDAVDPTYKEYQALQAIFSQSPHADKVYLYEIDRDDYTLAELTTGSGGTEIVWRSRNEGDPATNVQIHIDPQDDYHEEDVEFYKSLWCLSTGTAEYNPSSTSNTDFRVISKQSDYNQIYRLEVTSGAELNITVTDSDADGELDKLNIQVNSTYGNTPNEIADAINNHSEASALFKAEVGGDGTGTFDTTISETDIPFTVRAIPETDNNGDVVSTATEVADAVNDSETTDAPLVVHATSDGGSVVSSTGPSNLVETSSSPAELARAVDKMMEQCEEDQIEKPYFLIATTYGDEAKTGEVDGDRGELADAVGMRRMIYGTSNRDSESATDARVLANTMASSRAFVFAYKSDLTTEREWPEARLIGKWSGHDISDGVLFDTMWSPLQGLPNTTYTSTEQNRLEDDAPLNSAAFTYAKAKDTPVVTGSWSTSGEYLDWQQQKDFIEIYTETAVVSLLTSRAYVPGDSRGIAELETTVEEAFRHLTSLGIIGIKETDGGEVPMYSLDFPSLDEWSTMERASRHFIATARISPAWAIEQFSLTIYATLDTDEF